MIQTFESEIWKPVKIDIPHTNQSELQVSNLGRLRTFNKVSNGNIVKGSKVEGYPIIRLKLFKTRTKSAQEKFDLMQQEISALTKELRLMKAANEDPKLIEEKAALYGDLKKNLSKKINRNTLERTINWHSLIHKLVAQYFLETPKPDEVVIAHLDYNKLNNKANNLKWMTLKENFAHQRKNPNWINNKNGNRPYEASKNTAAKLTVTKVMLLKKMINQGKPMKLLVKQFKVTETQILRIKRGENWGGIPAAN